MRLEDSFQMMEMEPSTNNNEQHNIETSKLWGSVPCTNQGVMDETEFIAAASVETGKLLFARRSDEVTSSASFTSQDLLDALNAKKITRTSLLSRIELNSVDNELLLAEDRTNLRAKYGYDVGKQAYVYPEEALYLLELGKAEIFCNHVSLSVQRARSLLLVSQKTDKDRSGKIKCCTHEEFLVFKCLSRMGYFLYRYKPNSDTDTTCDGDSSQQIPQQIGGMETDDDVIIEENQAAGNGFDNNQQDVVEVDGAPEGASSSLRKTLKRKYSGDIYEEGQSGSSDEVMEDGFAEMQGNSPYVTNVDDEDSFQNEPSGYTVDEADSDVEIVDEVIFSHGGVEIQEIGHSVGCQDEFMEMSDEPVPSTSRGPPVSEVVVDLVSSEDEDEDSKEFGRKVWGKFVPNSKIFFTMPPSKLIPQSIPSGDNVYEFDLKDKSDISDLELEFLVDEVSLNDDKYGMFSSDSSHSFNLSGVKSWKEWRQNMFQEARNVMNNSLLASSDYINSEAATEKLFLWGESQKDSDSAASLANKIVFEMYGPAIQGYSRQRAFEGKPLYYVLISRQDESVPDFGIFGSSIDGVPFLIAVVCDSGENEVLFMTADRSPLNSLF